MKYYLDKEFKNLATPEYIYKNKPDNLYCKEISCDDELNAIEYEKLEIESQGKHHKWNAVLYCKYSSDGSKIRTSPFTVLRIGSDYFFKDYFNMDRLSGKIYEMHLYFTCKICNINCNIMYNDKFENFLNYQWREIGMATIYEINIFNTSCNEFIINDILE